MLSTITITITTLAFAPTFTAAPTHTNQSGYSTSTPIATPRSTPTSWTPKAQCEV